MFGEFRKAWLEGNLAGGLYLGIDCGTQGTKALLVDAEGTSLGRGYASHELIERPNGAREQEPRWWIDALQNPVRHCHP
jgi:xylulokinase